MMKGDAVAAIFSAPISVLGCATFLAAICALGCAARPLPCAAPGSCERGFSCIAKRCRPAGTELAPLDAQRMVVAPEHIAVIARGHWDTSLPQEIAFGNAAGASPVVLLRFPTPWGKKMRVARAFVTLEPLPGAVPPSEPVIISVARILEPWSPGEVSWGRMPRLSPYEGNTRGAAGTLRIDVTSIVQHWADDRSADQGIALTARSETSTGASFASGTSGATGPRLDVYLR